LMEVDFFSPHNTAIICIPQKGSENAILRSESAIDLLERIKKVYNEWVLPGHRTGANTHNISSTVSVGPEEWIDVREWMWENRSNYQAITALPRDYGSYIQPPFEDCSKEKYDSLMTSLTKVDLTQITELKDETELQSEPACAGGACTVNYG
jgi:ribonucleoside-triphosphate reductase (thioredoxin)